MITPKKYRLSNGVRVIIVKKNWKPLVTARIFVKAGSRHDNDSPGLAHLVEHLLFANSKSKRVPHLNDEMDRLGGRLDGETTKEYTAISMMVLKENFFLGLKLLADLLCNPQFTLDTIEDEKKIIVEEIVNSYSKSKILWDVFSQTLWKESPLRHPIMGSVNSVRSITYKDVWKFYNRYYAGKNTVVVIIGDFSYDFLENMMGKIFSSLNKNPPQIEEQSTSHVFNDQKNVHLKKRSLQTHLIVGYPGAGINSPDINGLKLLNKILGNGTGSRLYKRLRNDLHLVYSIASVVAIYEDTGYFAIWSNFNNEKYELIIEKISREFDRVKNERISDETLIQAKIRYRRDFLINFETDYSLAGFLGTSELLSGTIETIDDIFDDIESINNDALLNLSNKYFTNSHRFVVTIGRDPID